MGISLGALRDFVVKKISNIDQGLLYADVKTAGICLWDIEQRLRQYKSTNWSFFR